MQGRFCRLEPLAPFHAHDLFSAYALDTHGKNWAYLAYGPFAGFADYLTWLEDAAKSDDPLFYAILDTATGKAVGVASYLRIDQAHGVIEVGHLNYSPLLQRSPASTEAMFLMMRHVFDDLGYRRYEWKCNALNAPSKAAAVRLGFIYEGTFRQARVDKGRNRDTAWYSIIDGEWPRLKTAFEIWLAPENFGSDGRQKSSLRDLMAEAR